MTDEKAFLENYSIHDYDIPLCSVDMSIFAIIDKKLHVLMIQRPEHPCRGRWSLPGGFVDLDKDHSLDETAHRKLSEKTGVQSPYLEQVSSKGSKDRDPRGWSITVLYFALIDYQLVRVKDGKWVDIEEALTMDLAFDHIELLRSSLERLRSKTRYTALPIALMPKEFTLTELQTIFEVILSRTLQVKAFRTRLFSADVLFETGRSKIAGKRPAKLYEAKKISRDHSFPRALEK